jgi:glycosyltransferase involved in cell wall biosynthesis
MHSTKEPEHNKEKKLNILTEGLKNCDRILLHTIADMNRMKEYGIIENTTLFPHGVVFSEAQIKSPKKTQSRKLIEYTIGSFGYFLPNKGLLELIEAMKIIQKSGLKIKLYMYNAEYSIPESAELIAEAKELIKKNHLENLISLNTSYHCDDAIAEKLSTCDLMIFPYQKSDESSSAAVRSALGLSLPILVTPLEIFDEIKCLSNRTEGFSPQHIADAIINSLKNLYGESNQYQSFLDKLDDWKSEYSFSSIGYQLEGMITACYQDHQSDINK